MSTFTFVSHFAVSKTACGRILGETHHIRLKVVFKIILGISCFFAHQWYRACFSDSGGIDSESYMG